MLLTQVDGMNLSKNFIDLQIDLTLGKTEIDLTWEKNDLVTTLVAVSDDSSRGL